MAGLFRHNSPTRIYPLEYFHLKLLYHPRAFPNSSMRLFSRQSCQLCATPQTAAHQALGSSAHGFFQARIQEWVAISCCRGSSWPRDQTHISCTAGRFFTAEPPKKLKGKFTLTSNCSPLLCHVGKSSNPLISFEPVFLSFYNLYEKCSLCYSSINIVHSKSTDNF